MFRNRIEPGPRLPGILRVRSNQRQLTVQHHYFVLRRFPVILADVLIPSRVGLLRLGRSHRRASDRGSDNRERLIDEPVRITIIGVDERDHAYLRGRHEFQPRPVATEASGMSHARLIAYTSYLKSKASAALPVW